MDYLAFNAQEILQALPFALTYEADGATRSISQFAIYFIPVLWKETHTTIL